MKLLSIFLLVLFGSLGSAFGGTIIINTGVWGDAGNTASYDIETGILSDNILPHDQDAFVRTDGASLFIIESEKSAIIKCDPSAVSADNVIYHYSVGEGTYPYDMVFFESKAYVIMNVSNTIQVVNPNAENEEAFKISEIDISQWSDGDGFPDAAMGFVYDGIVFVVLQRVEKGYPLSNYGDSVIIKIDPSTDEIVDLDPDTDGIQGVKLILKNPQESSLVGSKLYLGCTSYGVEAGGVMIIDLSDLTGTQTVLFNEDSLDDETIFDINVFSDDFGLVCTLNDSWYAGVPRVFNPQDGTIGDELPVPDSGGGIAMSDGRLFIGVRDENNPGLYIVDMDNMTVVDIKPTELQPYSIIYIDKDISTLVSDTEDIPESFSIEAVYPNPFNNSATINFRLERPNDVCVDIYNTVGQRVATLMNSFFTPGSHSIVWNAGSMASGMYYIQFSDGISVKSKKVTLIK